MTESCKISCLAAPLIHSLTTLNFNYRARSQWSLSLSTIAIHWPPRLTGSSLAKWIRINRSREFHFHRVYSNFHEVHFYRAPKVYCRNCTSAASVMSDNLTQLIYVKPCHDLMFTSSHAAAHIAGELKARRLRVVCGGAARRIRNEAENERNAQKL